MGKIEDEYKLRFPEQNYEKLKLKSSWMGKASIGVYHILKRVETNYFEEYEAKARHLKKTT